MAESNPAAEIRHSAAVANRRWRKNLSALCREYTKEAVGTLVEIMRDVNAPANSRVKCAIEILDRGWGKAPVTVNVSAGGALDLSSASDDELRKIIEENTKSLMAEAEESPDEDDFAAFFEDDGQGGGRLN